MIALLRGINVGKHNRLKMAELRSGFEALGHTRVATHLQSGNVVFQPADPGMPSPELAQALAAMLADRFGIVSPVVLRTSTELDDALGRSPFVDAEEDLALLHLILFDQTPSPERVAQLDADVGLPDRFEVIGREVALWYPEGSARSKLTINYFEKVLDVSGTARNHRTLRALVPMDAALT